MNEIRLPALTGDSPLGVLAAIGVLRLLTSFTTDAPLLCWDPGGLTAVLHGPYGDADEVAEALTGVLDSIPDDSVLPGVAAGFPPPGAAPDGMRVLRSDLPATTTDMLIGMTNEERQEALRWLASLVTDLVVDDKGRVAISQFTAPSGKQSMATMLEKPLEHIRRDPDLLHQALVGWRRVAGVTGEYLDHRAMWDATEDANGSANMRGVPGATWLALMGYPILRTTASTRGRATTSGWHVAINARTKRIYDELRLPIWTQPLSPPRVTALLEHPAFSAVAKNGEVGHPEQLQALGVIHVCRARRFQPPGGKSAGVLTTNPS